MVVRSTMGAAYRVPFCYVDDLAEEVKQMKEAGICTYAAHLEGKIPTMKKIIAKPVHF